MKPMSLIEKIRYLWETFKVYTPIVIVVGIMLTGLVFSILNLNTEVIISGSLVNVVGTEEGIQYLTDDYGIKVGAKRFQREVQIDEISYGDPNSNSELEYNFQLSSKLFAMATGGTLDFLLMSKPAMGILMADEMFLDLREILTEEEMKQWEGKLVYCEFTDERGSVPVALDLSDTQFAKDCLSKEMSYYISFVVTTPRKEACRDYLAYILAWDGSQMTTQPTTK